MTTKGRQRKKNSGGSSKRPALRRPNPPGSFLLKPCWRKENRIRRRKSFLPSSKTPPPRPVPKPATGKRKSRPPAARARRRASFSKNWSRTRTGRGATSWPAPGSPSAGSTGPAASQRMRPRPWKRRSIGAAIRRPISPPPANTLPPPRPPSLCPPPRFVSATPSASAKMTTINVGVLPRPCSCLAPRPWKPAMPRPLPPISTT